MNDTVAHKDVWQDDSGIVNVHTASLKVNSKVLAVQSGDHGVVHEVSAVKYLASNDVVLED